MIRHIRLANKCDNTFDIIPQFLLIELALDSSVTLYNEPVCDSCAAESCADSNTYRIIALACSTFYGQDWQLSTSQDGCSTTATLLLGIGDKLI